MASSGSKPTKRKGNKPEGQLVKAENALSIRSDTSKRQRRRSATCVCGICEKSSQEVGFPTNEQGQPCGDICLDDQAVAVAISPELSQSAGAVVKAYVDGSTDYKTRHDSAKLVYAQLKKQQEVAWPAGAPHFSPPSSVATTTSTGSYVYYELGLLTEAEFERLIGCVAKDVGVRPVKVKNEEGIARDFFPVSLMNLSPNEVFGIRRLQVGHRVAVEQQEHLLFADRQLVQDQGDTWRKFASDVHVASLPSGAKVSGRPGLHTVPELRAKAQAIQEARSNAVEAHHGLDSEESQAGSEDLLDEMDGSQSANAPRHTAAVSAKVGSLSATVATPKVKRTPKKNKTADETDEISSTGAVARSLGDLSRVDPEMAVVAFKHESVTGRPSSGSLANLQIRRFLQGEKLGHFLNGGRKVLETLSQHKCKETHVLSERLARAEAATLLTSGKVSTLRRPDLIKHLLILKEDLQDFKFPLLTECTGRLVSCNFEKVITVEEERVEGADERLLSFVSSVCFWNKCTDVKVLDPERPSFLPLVSKLQQLESDRDISDAFGGPADPAEGGEPEQLEQHWKDLAASFQETVLHDSLLDLLCRVDNASARDALIKVCSAFLEESLRSVPQQDSFFEAWSSASCLKEPLESLVRFCKLVLTLFQKTVTGFDTDPDTVPHYLSYSGANMFEKSVRHILSLEKSEEAQGMSKAARGILQDCVKDVVRTGASQQHLLPKMQTLSTQLDDKPGLASLFQACQELPQLREGLRKGATTAFELKLKQYALGIVGNLGQQGETEFSCISSEELAQLEQVLRGFEEDEHMLAALGNLHKFATKHNVAIAHHDLQVWLAKFVDAEKASAPATVTFEVLKQVLVKCGKSLPSMDNLPKAAEAIFFMLKGIALEAGEANSERLKIASDSVAAKSAVVRHFVKSMRHPHADFAELVLDAARATMAAKLAGNKLQGLHEEVAVRCQKDLNHALLKDCVSSLRARSQAIAGLQEKMATTALEDLGEEVLDTDPTKAVFNVGFEGMSSGLYLDSIVDSVNFTCASLSESLSGNVESVSKVCGEWLETSWRQDLAEDADPTTILSVAQDTISQIKGRSLKPLLESLEKECHSCIKFLDHFLQEGDERGYVSEMNLTETFSNLADTLGASKLQLAKAGALFQQCVFWFCLKTFYDDSITAAEKDKKVANLVSQWAQVSANKFGVTEGHIFPGLSKLVKSHLK